MLQYLIRRIFIMLPTLLGISLVTLTLVHLAPGDPVQAQMEGAMGKGTITPEEIAERRRTYFLHLPVLLNFSPEDSRTINRKLIQDLLQEKDTAREQAVRRLILRGGMALKPVVEVLPSAPDRVRVSILAGLESLAGRMGIAEGLAGATDKVAFWEDVVRHMPADPEAVASESVRELMAHPDAPAPPVLRQLDTLAYSQLMSSLLSLDASSAAAIAITRELSRISGVDGTIREGDPLASRLRAIDDWRRWWAPKRADYIDFNGVQRVVAVVSETQYGKWVRRLVTLDFDRSIRDNLPIRQKLGERLKVTLTLAMLSLMVAYFIAIPLGVFSAVKQYSLADRIVTVILFILYSLPSFWLAMLLQQYLCGVDKGGLSLFPLVGLTSADFEQLSLAGKLEDLTWHLFLPVLVLTYASFASLSRFQRVGMLEIIRQDFIRTARAKGLPERTVILKHALRNSVLPIITLLGMNLPALVGGAVIVESIFTINGMGLETLEAVRTRDMNWIMASVTLTALMTMAGLLLSDVLYAFVDPRIQVGNKEGNG